MNGTSSATCFFSFGPDDSFISKSYEGLRYNDLPPALLALINGGSVRDVHWVSQQSQEASAATAGEQESSNSRTYVVEVPEFT